MFIPESGQPVARPFDRAYLARHLNANDGPNACQVPLLYSLVDEAKHKHLDAPSPERTNVSGGGGAAPLRLQQ